ncbi:ferredoxin [Smaragdicoccus niigatensis]|uniref:ferredoxin n=1 Tax=Smaragdicoccus niigatensis TaxID=359359 RepID=UPI000477E2B3|nr:ferredoxin [Smaragdicoccus niigatensis]
MNIRVDRNRCEGHAMCVSLVPEIFDVGDDGKVRLLTETVEASQVADAQLAVDSCPVQALRLTD